MSSKDRSIGQRERDRLDRLHGRVKFVQARIDRLALEQPEKNTGHDIAEVSALKWAIGLIEGMLGSEREPEEKG